MTRDLRRAARALWLPALALGFVVAFAPGRTGLAIRDLRLALCGAALLSCWRRCGARTRGDGRSRAPRRRRARAGATPASSRRLEQETALGVAGSFDLHYRLRPRLRALAGGPAGRPARRIARRGARAGARAPGRDDVGARAPRPPPPEDRLAAGLPINDLGHVVDVAGSACDMRTRRESTSSPATCSTRSSGRSSASATRSSSSSLGFLADGHVLLEDFPGLAKTLAARSFAQTS